MPLADLDVSGNSLILLVVLVLMVLFVGIGLYTRRGSGIETRPWDGTQGAPGAAGPEEVSGRDEGEGSTLSQHGTDSKDSERD
jgi:hypothetical protein